MDRDGAVPSNRPGTEKSERLLVAPILIWVENGRIMMCAWVTFEPNQETKIIILWPH